MPKDALLAAHAARGAYTDCYGTTVPGRISLAVFVEAFLTTPLFRLERWVLSAALKMPSSDEGARQLAHGASDRFAAWKLEQRTEGEILLDAGQTRLWLSVVPETASGATTTLRMGSAVLPMRRNGEFGVVFHALLGFHKLYTRLLLRAAAQRACRMAARGQASASKV